MVKTKSERMLGFIKEYTEEIIGAGMAFVAMLVADFTSFIGGVVFLGIVNDGLLEKCINSIFAIVSSTIVGLLVHVGKEKMKEALERKKELRKQKEQP